MPTIDPHGGTLRNLLADDAELVRLGGDRIPAVGVGGASSVVSARALGSPPRAARISTTVPVLFRSTVTALSGVFNCIERPDLVPAFRAVRAALATPFTRNS